MALLQPEADASMDTTASIADLVTAILRRSNEFYCHGISVRMLENQEHVIYKIKKNTSADLCYEVEVGDVLECVNGTHVLGLTTKEVSRKICTDPLTIVLRKDKNIKRLVYEMIKTYSPERSLPTHPREKPERLEVELLAKYARTVGCGIHLQETFLLDHVVSHIVENSPAVGMVEVGDVVLKVNGVEIQYTSIFQAVKYLARASYPMKLEILRDPYVKQHLHEVQSMSKTHRRNSSPSPFWWYGTDNDDGHRKCRSETDRRPSRIPLPVSWAKNPLSAPQSPSRESNPRCGSQKSGMSKASRYIFTGTSQFLQACDDWQGEMTTESAVVGKGQHARGIKTIAYYDHQTAPGRENESPLAPTASDGEMQDQPGYDQQLRTSLPVGSFYPFGHPFIEHCHTLPTSPPIYRTEAADGQEKPMTERERFLWMNTSSKEYGAPDRPVGQSFSSSMSSSPQSSVSESLASPTSVSSSVMSSAGGSREHSHVGHVTSGAAGGLAADKESTTAADLMSTNATKVEATASVQAQKQQQHPGQGAAVGGVSDHHGVGGDHSVSEAVSNISSPDYQDEHDLFSSRDLAAMAISDHSDDSDSTILASETTHRFDLLPHGDPAERDHKIVIQVVAEEGADGEETLSDSDSKQLTLDLQEQEQQTNGDTSPPVSDEGSDAESGHIYHYLPKGIDRPSVERLARRLFRLEGFSKKDVCRHLSKNNEFSSALGLEYLKYYDFSNMTLDAALRTFVSHVPLFGETQERDRVIFHFSQRYLDNNAGAFKSVGATHMLVCALLILNIDMHSEISTRRTFAKFASNLDFQNDGEHFSRELLRNLYVSIKDHRLEPAIDDEEDMWQAVRSSDNSGEGGGFNPGEGQSAGAFHAPSVGPNPFLEVPRTFPAVEVKTGFVMRKSLYEPNHKKTSIGHRSWKMFFCTLRELVLYMTKDKRGFCELMACNEANGIRIHHAYAWEAKDYKKRSNVFQLQTADQSEFLFQLTDKNEMRSWIDTINYMCAAYSAPPLDGAVGSQKKFQRPLLPCSKTKLGMRQQLASHEAQLKNLEQMSDEHYQSEPSSKKHALEYYEEKQAYLKHELRRYESYCELLQARLTMDTREFSDQFYITAAAVSQVTIDGEGAAENVSKPRLQPGTYINRRCVGRPTTAHGTIGHSGGLARRFKSEELDDSDIERPATS